MVNEYMLTTVDNPFDPFEQFDSWNMFDKQKGYNSCERLARFVDIEDDMSEEEVSYEIEKAIDTIVQIDFLDIFKKVQRKTTTN